MQQATVSRIDLGTARGPSRNPPYRRAGPTGRTATAPRQLPLIRGDVIAEDVEIPLRVSNLEVAVIGRQPPVGNFGNFDLALPKPESSRRFASAIAGMTLDFHYPERGRVL